MSKRIPIVDSKKLTNVLIGVPSPIANYILTIRAHCTVIIDEEPSEKVQDLVACITHNCMELAEFVAKQLSKSKEVDLADVYGHGPSAPGWKEPS